MMGSKFPSVRDTNDSEGVFWNSMIFVFLKWYHEWAIRGIMGINNNVIIIVSYS